MEERTGTENYSYYLLMELLKLEQGHTFRLYLRPGDNIVNEWVKRIKEVLPNTGNFELIVVRPSRLWTQIGLAWELWRNPVDILFIPAHTLPILRPKKIKTVVTIHDLGYEYLPQYHQFPHKLWLTYFTEYAAHHADKVIAVSEATKEDLVRKFDVPDSRIEVIYEGFVPRSAHAYDPKIILQQYKIQKPYLVFVGTVQPRKNLERAVEALAMVKKHEEFKALGLVIIGKNGWLSEPIYTAPKRFGVEEAVTFLGYVPEEDAQVIWKNAEATFFATLFEGFGIPILESQAMGVPVITSNRKPFTEVGGEMCVYVDPESADDIARGLVKCLTDRELRAHLIMGGEENIKKFSWQKAAEETLKVLESV